MTEHAVFTLGEAAKATGKSKTAIANAIKTGRISAMGKEGGSYQIAASELFRVYPFTGDVDRKGERYSTPENAKVDSALQVEVEGLREQIGLLTSERDDLRQRLTKSDDERTRLTTLLTDQRQKSTVPERSGWRLFGFEIKKAS